MEQIFARLTQAVEGSIHIALGAAFLWGILSIVLSPCHLASIPLIVGFISEQGRLTVRRAFLLSSLFALGILVTIALIGLVTSGLGRMMGDVGRAGNYAVAAVFFLVGLHLLGVIPMPFSAAGPSEVNRKGPLAAFLLGLIFGIALGPCTFAYMAPILAISFREGSKDLVRGIVLLLFYGLGHCSVIAAAGTSAEAVQTYLEWQEKSRALAVVKAICGVLVMLGGVYLVWSAR
ncbi:MAG: cytochrome c biogenesis protein CcdA [Armatimonadota bacterium]|nr:cytochrome c biogenesis protein CcdA [Armatimonadota bacterium]